MRALDDLTFEPMYVLHVEGRQDGLFRAYKGKRLTAADRRPGRTPFVGGSRMNNSITDFADTPALFPGGWVTLIYNGDGGTGHARYQPAPFSASDDVIALEPLSAEATKSALLLIACLLTQQCVSKFGFGYKLTQHRLGRQKIMVPVTTNADGEQVINWAGMARLGDELFAEVVSRTKVARRIGPNDDSLPDLTFEPMLINDVFETMKSSSAWCDKSKLSMEGNGLYPFVSRTRANNGVDGFCVGQGKEPELGNAVTIGLDTQTTTYQPVPFYTSQNIQVLRHGRLNEDTGAILAALIDQQMGKFGWGGNGATLGRLARTRIMVPVTTDADGEHTVDWEGMNRYGSALRSRAERSLDAVLDGNLKPSP